MLAFQYSCFNALICFNVLKLKIECLCEGFNHNTSAGLISLLATGCAVGSFFGGFLGDRISRKYPNGGRILCAQFSVFVGIPFSWFLLRGIPQSETALLEFAAVLLLMGLTISWPQNCANNPIFAEIVPAKQRTMIYAFDRAIEGSLSSLAAPAVGYISERIYGYGSSNNKAMALSKGLFSMMAVPWCLCGLLYTPLYFTFEEDRAQVDHDSMNDELIPLATSS